MTSVGECFALTRRARIAGVGLLGLLIAAWLTSLPFAPFVRDQGTGALGTDKPSGDDLIAIAKWRVTSILTADECQEYRHEQTCPPGP
jgi:hypothetical protein